MFEYHVFQKKKDMKPSKPTVYHYSKTHSQEKEMINQRYLIAKNQ